MTCVPHPVAASALARPSRPVLMEGDVRIQAGAFAWQVAAYANILATQGVQAGHTVALHGVPGVAMATALHAVGWLGAAVLPLPPGATAAEWTGICAAACPDWFLATGTAVAPACDIGVPKLAWPAALPDTAQVAPGRDWPLGEVRLRMATSGTSGVPKVAALTTAQLLFNAMGTSWRLGHLPHDRWLCCLPLHHVGGLMILMRAAWSGAQVQLMPRFDAALAAAALDSGTIHLVSLVPAMLERILDARDPVPFAQSLRAVVLGGAAASPALVKRCGELGVPLALSWGMTETASQVATGWADETAVVGDCGPPLAFARVRAAGPVLQVEGPVVGAPLTTSDRGHVDDAGHVHVHGRSDDVIISGGENIAPEEVEAVLCAHPDVHEAAVLAIPSERWGQRPVALVAPHRHRRVAPEGLRAWCEGRLSGFKVPAAFAVCAALPRTPLGKVSRRALGVSWRAGVFHGGVVSGPQRESAQTGRESAAGLGAATAGLVDEGMHHTDAGAHSAVGLRDGVVEGDRALADVGDHQVHVEHVAHAGGGAPVGVGVHDGHHPVAADETLLQGAEHGDEKLLEGGVAVLEEARKKNHAGPVDIEKANRDPMVKKHG